MTDVVERAMRNLLEEEEMSFDYFILTQLWPLDTDVITSSVRDTRRLIVVVEDVPAYSVGAAVVSQVSGELRGHFSSAVVGLRVAPIPSARHLEDASYPSPDSIRSAILGLL
jgi:pyruvate/2-oxoglutarate/acetoin dehydrogenase E1 component